MEIRVGKLSFRVWRLGDGRHAFDYTVGSKRRVVARRDIEDLKAAAHQLAPQILNGRTEALALTDADQRIYVAARQALGSIPVDSAARDYAEAAAIAPGISMRDLALFYKRAGRIELKPVTVSDAYAIFLADRSELDLSSRQARSDRGDVGAFVAAFKHRHIADISQEEILSWLRSEQSKRNIQWRRRNNIRDAVALLFSHAKCKGWLAHDRQTAAELVPSLPRPKRSAPIAIYTPSEMASLIAEIRPHYFPWLVIGGFAGIRSEEIAPDPRSNKDPLRWEDFDWDHNVIRVRRETSKVGEPRAVPILPNLAKWLADCTEKRGVVCPGEQPSKSETCRLSKVCGYTDDDGVWKKFAWKTNGLRHSFGSYRLAVIKNRDQLAEEMGNSVQMIRQHYNEARSEAEGNAWFAISPAEAARNILQHRFAF